VVAEGYTDVLALSQAGVENAVGLMGTALTEAQVRELTAAVGAGGTIDLALDADASGQEAMVRAAALASGHDVTLRVVPLPDGLDPADLVARDGASRVASLLEEAVPFARFRVEHILAAAELRTPEGRDRALAALRPVIAALPAGVTREELTRTVASRLQLSEELAGSLISERRSASTPTPSPRARVVLARRDQAERTFLALCIALPEQGREALRRVSLDEHFSSPLVRRAAEHLRGHLAAPLDGLPREDEALAELMAELTIRAGRDPADPSMLEVELLQLEKDRLERQIAAGGSVADLAQKRDQVTKDIRTAVTRAMERTAGGG
jgi:DNA primase